MNLIGQAFAAILTTQPQEPNRSNLVQPSNAIAAWHAVRQP
jgi:hypothetical protein